MTSARIPPQRVPTSASPASEYPKPLPVGTRVKRNIGGQTGTVQPYRNVIPRMGTFPVAWDSRVTGCQIWEICGADDVTIVAEAPVIAPKATLRGTRRRPA